MLVNNPMSHNFQTIVRRTIDQLYLVCRPRAPSQNVHQACGLVFLLRLFLKHNVQLHIEYLESER